MTRRLYSGLYEDLLTSALEAEINARTAEGWRVDVATADSTVRPELLARHVYHLLRRALEGIPEEDGAQPANQVALANRLVEVLVEHGAMADDRVADAARLLLEAVERRALGGTQSAVPPSDTLASSDRSARQRTARRPDRKRDCAGDPECRSDRFAVRIRAALGIAAVPFRAGRTGTRGRTRACDRKRLYRVDRTAVLWMRLSISVRK